MPDVESFRCIEKGNTIQRTNLLLYRLSIFTSLNIFFVLNHIKHQHIWKEIHILNIRNMNFKRVA